MLWSVTESVLETGHSLMIENAFKVDINAPRLRDIRERLRPRIAEIHCLADREVLVERVEARMERGHRHPGHGEQDAQTLGTSTQCSSISALRFGMEGVMGVQNSELQLVEVGDLETKDAESRWAAVNTS